MENAMELDYFFSNAVINFKIKMFENFDPLLENIDHFTFKVIVNYRKHPSVIEIASELTKEWFFLFLKRNCYRSCT